MTWRSSRSRVDAFMSHFPYQPPEHAVGSHAGQHVTQWDGRPHTFQTEDAGEDEEAGDEEQQLSGEAQEDALAGMADALEKVGVPKSFIFISSR